MAERIKAEIASSGSVAGELLPSEANYVERFGVSRITVRRSLELLRSDGIVESRQGVGWIIMQGSVRQVLGRFATIEDQLLELGIQPRRRILSSRIYTAAGRVEEVLGGGEVREVVRVNLADEIPFAVVTVWVSAYLGAEFSREELEEFSFYELLSRSDRLRAPLDRAIQTIAAVLIVDEEARLLGVADRSPGLLCERITFDTSDQPVLLSRFLFPGLRTAFEVELTSQVGSIAPGGLRLVE
ncbi:MAG: GntR family transcriptional regulator [Ferrimicrobium sp.]